MVMRTLLPLALILAPIGATATDNPRAPTATLEPSPEIVRMVDTLFGHMLAPGVQQGPDWDMQGIDLLVRLADAPEGSDHVALMDDTRGERSVDHYGNGTVPIPPAMITLAELPGQIQSGEVRWQSVTELADGVWLQSSARLTRRGNALCGKGWETLRIIAPADAPLSEEARVAATVVRLMSARMASMELCTMTFALPDGSLQQRSFLPDGRPLPALDEDTGPVRIRPLADAPALFTP